ncbi:hypothetical protein AAA799P11_00331 [Marine Group I thaumarchaeote SCGC AAA799-P11]|uniref:Uncharacterized protein n=1 Tax=Marine Group I thaumarchaeote SCGC AAA799-P11 TaxID=1502295 RepID=A0A087S2S2_9ARCH|nr:hypothetical protein AAA799P11_00331 [Marine Group I thaumarchaeote SCGC AAA799-P11]
MKTMPKRIEYLRKEQIEIEIEILEMVFTFTQTTYKRTNVQTLNYKPSAISR